MTHPLGEETEELLHHLLSHEGRHKAGDCCGTGERRGSNTARLIADGYAVLAPDGTVTLTPKGEEEATLIVRRHRLAERLLVDVLDLRGPEAHDQACRFEHILRPDVEERICTLLGHPRGCPHGAPIPPGRCCREAATELRKVVGVASALEADEAGTVAYIHTDDARKMNKLLATGILPGQPIRLLRKFPSYVFQVGNTQYAVDRDIADAIYVRLSERK